MKESSIRDDRSAQTSAELIQDERIARLASQVVEPAIGIERRIPMEFEKAAMKLVGAGAGEDLHLAGSPSQFRVGWRCDDSDLFDDIDAGKDNRVDPVI